MERPCFLGVLLLGISGCARGVVADHPHEAPSSPAAEIDVPRTVVTPEEALTIPELFERAEQAAAEGQLEQAAELFERVGRTDEEAELAPAAWLRAAELRERLGDRPAAVARLERVARRYPDHPLAQEALVRLVRQHAYMEEWERAGRAATSLLPRVEELPPLDQVVVHGGKALELVFAGRLDEASYFVEKGRNVVDAHQLDRAGRFPRDLAQLYFALGEVRRARAERIEFVPLPEDFGAVLERRCQLLLDAQSAYSDAMRAYDAHWSAMAGYRVGELYRSLHDDLMEVPVPQTADTADRRALFEGAMRLRYTVLLDKAGAMMDHTLAMAERTGERSQWVERARSARSAIDRAIAREDAAIDALPYTRAELRAALDALRDRARARAE